MKTKEQHAEYMRTWRKRKFAADPEYKAAYMERNRKWKTANPEKQREAQRKWRKKHQRAYDLQRHYGITEQQFQDKLLAQAGRCAICQDLMTRPNIDHDHVSGVVRDLLCTSCNHAIGKLKDNPAIVQQAANYLRRWKEV